MLEWSSPDLHSFWNDLQAASRMETERVIEREEKRKT